ncbi:Nucleoside-diphosphate-sugar epimerase [Algoriphagus ornithinivorans]|uniref:Nucleoside-diphosphate-sugar epimerase n=1 Tax=Algoriphagus ornithinivorans TaxID=226506 RepID=A0A1I5G7L8_9BACT|nr:NAD-dependent epimerase/dehydratase family protein [Algoriphagus ornithinivorans]SFO32065.1 Nucleoside-diphosphate-sugar epimerase [Algoriphagus ornithinivorans]
MKILITGITGLLGSYLAKELRALGEIHGLRRKQSSDKLIQGLDFPIHWHEGSLADMDALESALQEIDLVVHCAGLVSFNPADTDRLYHVNVEGTANLINALLNTGVKKLVHVSSVAAIGRSIEAKIIDENFKWTESPLNTEYAVSKYWGELEAWRGAQEGLDVMVVNPSVLLPKVEDERSSASVYQFILKGNSFYPTGNINYLDIRDAAEMIRKLIQKEAWGERFILNAASIPFRDFFEKMATVFQKSAPTKPAKGLILNLAVFFTGIGRKLGLTENPLNKKTAKIASQKITFDGSKAVQLLDFEFKSLEDTFSWAK